MNEKSPNRLTFALLDKNDGISDPSLHPGEEYPLPAWYRAVREKPLEKLSVEDICKACRQQIHIEYVVPIALGFLQSDPLTGEMYDGELLASLKSVSPNYWAKHAGNVATVRTVCKNICTIDGISDDVRQDVAVLLKKTTSKV